MPEISKAYEPQSVEDKWYRFWLDRKCFVADPARVTAKRPAYAIVIPPPNVTGVLTMGHVLNNTIQDILARKARMDGKEVLWLPGTDHAGIATEGLVARLLAKEEKKSKRDLERDEFIKRVWTWKEKYGGIIISQLKKLGCSCDWTRERFTMDEPYLRCVQRVFVELYRKGLIYRGKRMVNWCPASQTALSDEEVVMKEQKGSLYYFKVEIAEMPGTFLTIATTRPETIPGDTAVAVNPKDPRYTKFIGKHIIRPLPAELPREQKLIPVIGDEHVDFEFGTGVLKVTPAHDKADFDIGQRHKLAVIEVISANGHMTDLAGADLKGLDRFKARKVAAEKLTELGALEKEEPYTNNVGFSERADVPIEPRLSEQWFLKYPSVEKSHTCVEQPDEKGSAGASPAAVGAPADRSKGAHDSSGTGKPARPFAADEASAAAREARALPGKMRFHPQRWAKVYDHWMGNIQDWCISRQLWWGHRIPVWTLPLHVKAEGVTEQLKEYFSEWEVGESVLIEIEKGEPDYGDGIRFLTANERADAAALKLNAFYQSGKFDASLQEGYPTSRAKALAEAIMSGPAAGQATQDPDVLDTWFSSWLWPFATMGWPEQTTTLKAFYPTNDLVTGPDIIFFWVARMIMAGYEFMSDPKFGLPDAKPFRNVYFTGIIRDKQGRKMSKSLGNSPDPLDLIAKFGADALRFGTMRSAPLGQDILFDEQNVELGRNFCNKLWNACRFRQMMGSAPAPGAAAGAPPAEIQGEIDPKLLTSDDKWILLKLDQAIREMNTAFAEYKFSDATATLYRFFWSEYCDWYVEASKAVLGSAAAPAAPVGAPPTGTSATPDVEREARSTAPEAGALPEQIARKANTLAVIDFVLSHALRLFHPFLPFITEELWHGMGYAGDMPENQGGQTIMSAPWPKPLDEDFKSHYGLTSGDEQQIEKRNELVSQGRNLRRTASIAANKRVKFILKPARELAPHDVDVLKLLLNAEAVEVNAAFQPGKNTMTVRTELGDLYLPTEGLIDVEAEKARLTKELQKIEAEISKVEQKLANPNFAQKVPANVLEEHKQRLVEWQGKREHVKAALAALEG